MHVVFNFIQLCCSCLIVGPVGLPAVYFYTLVGLCVCFYAILRDLSI